MGPRRFAALVAAAGLLALASGPPAPGGGKRVAGAIERWIRVARDTSPAHDITRDTRRGTLPVLEGAAAALEAGRPRLALYRLSAAWPGLAAAEYLAARSAAGQADSAGLESEWRRLRPLGRTPARAAEGARPALARALAEAALPQARIYHEAALEYGHADSPASGLYYLGAALGQREFVAFARTLDEPAGTPPPLRAIGPELEALERRLMAAYRPPASLDRHRDFITASAALKEARELDALGLRHGALQCYLLAAMRTGVVTRGVSRHDPAPIAERLRALENRLDPNVDHGIARLFAEIAAADLALADSSHTTAAVTAGEVLPLYLAALEPATPGARRPAPEVTVTLVRWPYT